MLSRDPPVSSSAEFEEALRSLNEASATVFPVDARGLLAIGGSLVTEQSSLMEQAAAHTGGSMFRGEELEAAGQRIAEETRSSWAG